MTSADRIPGRPTGAWIVFGILIAGIILALLLHPSPKGLVTILAITAFLVYGTRIHPTSARMKSSPESPSPSTLEEQRLDKKLRVDQNSPGNPNSYTNNPLQ